MLTSYVRTVFLYCLLIGVIRLMGKRQIGQMEPSEFVVTMLVADLAAIPMQDGGVPLLAGLVPILTVLSMELILSSLSLRSLKLRRVLCGKPVILIENGNILQDNLQNTRITLDELAGHLRQKDVLDIGTVQFAILETNGNLSVFPFPDARPASAKDAGIDTSAQFLPVTVISDGCIIKENLKKAKKDALWLDRVLKKNGVAAAQIQLLTVDESGKIRLYRRHSE